MFWAVCTLSALFHAANSQTARVVPFEASDVLDPWIQRLQTTNQTMRTMHWILENSADELFKDQAPTRQRVHSLYNDSFGTFTGGNREQVNKLDYDVYTYNFPEARVPQQRSGASKFRVQETGLTLIACLRGLVDTAVFSRHQVLFEITPYVQGVVQELPHISLAVSVVKSTGTAFVNLFVCTSISCLSKTPKDYVLPVYDLKSRFQTIAFVLHPAAANNTQRLQVYGFLQMDEFGEMVDRPTLQIDMSLPAITSTEQLVTLGGGTSAFKSQASIVVRTALLVDAPPPEPSDSDNILRSVMQFVDLKWPNASVWLPPRVFPPPPPSSPPPSTSNFTLPLASPGLPAATPVADDCVAHDTFVALVACLSAALLIVATVSTALVLYCMHTNRELRRVCARAETAGDDSDFTFKPGSTLSIGAGTDAEASLTSVRRRAHSSAVTSGRLEVETRTPASTQGPSDALMRGPSTTQQGLKLSDLSLDGAQLPTVEELSSLIPLAEGFFGQVFVIQYDGRLCALKVFKPLTEVAAHDVRVIAQDYNKELQLLAMLGDPTKSQCQGITRLLGHGSIGDRPVLLMELSAGFSLNDHLYPEAHLILPSSICAAESMQEDVREMWALLQSRATACLERDGMLDCPFSMIRFAQSSPVLDTSLLGQRLLNASTTGRRLELYHDSLTRMGVPLLLQTPFLVFLVGARAVGFPLEFTTVLASDPDPMFDVVLTLSRQLPALSIPHRVRILRQVQEKLVSLHRGSSTDGSRTGGTRPVIVHGDLKPANILLDEEGNALLADVGLAVALRLPEDKSYVVGKPVGSGLCGGTRGYRDPERQAEQRRQARFGPKNDIYSVAVVLLELMSAPSIGRINPLLTNFLQRILAECLGLWEQRPSSEQLLQYLEEMEVLSKHLAANNMLTLMP